MRLIRFPGHKLHRCDEEWCKICPGGLAYCVLCGGGEGSLPSDCPGQKMENHTEDAVYDGTLDYIRDIGWIKPTHFAWRKRL